MGMRFGGAFLFERIQRIFVGVVPLRQLGFIEVIRRIVVAEFRVAKDIFFGFEPGAAGIGVVMCATGVVGIVYAAIGSAGGVSGSFVRVFCFCHTNVLLKTHK